MFNLFRFRLAIVLGTLIMPGMMLGFGETAQAQGQSAHFYCDGLARDIADRNASGSALGGGIRRSESWDSIYRREYNNCMRRNGYR